MLLLSASLIARRWSLTVPTTSKRHSTRAAKRPDFIFPATLASSTCYLTSADLIVSKYMFLSHFFTMSLLMFRTMLLYSALATDLNTSLHASNRVNESLSLMVALL